MSPHFDALEIRDPAERERDLLSVLPHFLSGAVAKAEGLAAWLSGYDLSKIVDRVALARLPVLRKPELLELQQAKPPFGGFVDPDALEGARVFMSPGPIWEIQGAGADPWQAARAFFAAGVRPGARVHNAFAYHMTPGGFVLDTGARALGCSVFPAGTGNTDMQVEAAEAFRPDVYAGTPDFLKIMLERADRDGRDLSSFRIGLVSGGALFPSLREEYRARGINVLQCYATAEFGVIAYESTGPDGAPLPGMVVNENLIVEIVRPGTDDPVPEGEVGEVVVTSLNPAYPLVRLGTGDLSAVLREKSPCGRTNMRIRGWMGRADQRTKVKGMFVDPKQIAELTRRHGEIERARLVVTRDGASDAMALHVETITGTAPDTTAIETTLREVTRVGGRVVLAEPGSLPRDGKVIADEREYSD
ncbi:Phenylacetate-CoA ligase [Nitratireductor aquibiodomus RA22]|uniref:Phenylacetate-CoA ligase n=1 Tax=Nitratireductor aquibiodomus RA22 TaxID=1189611 RepID=I5BYK0_9HYPH|nr:AMP-binding protein [Nitratireductor aquibiodomus]EIM74652.1 Phenylacetate-CoA ligase [Nitratireductor aquibiodomus RA22]